MMGWYRKGRYIMASNLEVTADDIQALAIKLSQFIDTLTPGERAAFQVVEWYLAISALEDEHEVSGYSAPSPERLAPASASERERLWLSLTSSLVEQHTPGANES
ncbi:hypothetical protein BH23CHL2_BH23CHL2_11190 [soil metagenome]